MITPQQPLPVAVGVRFESPALAVAAAGGDASAYELKFLLTAAQAREAEAALARALEVDPHADPAFGNGYRVTSVYLDTPAFDVLRRTEAAGGHKHRVRRYGSAPMVFLERKSKKAGRVTKHRTAVPAAEADFTAAPDGWAGAWFAREVAARGLRPVCRVTYDRSAFVGRGPTGTVRATLDRAARGEPAADLAPDPTTPGRPLLTPDEAILGLKYLNVPPPLFKQLIGELQLIQAGVSKYRRCAAALGLGAEGRADG